MSATYNQIVVVVARVPEFTLRCAIYLLRFLPRNTGHIQLTTYMPALLGDGAYSRHTSNSTVGVITMGAAAMTLPIALFGPQMPR